MKGTEFRADVVEQREQIVDALRWLNIVSLQLVPGNSWNVVFKAVGRNDAWAVKVYNDRRRPGALLRDLSVGAHLTQQLVRLGVPGVVAASLWPNGDVVGVVDNRFAVSVFPWIHGRQAANDDVSSCAEWLATFQSCSLEALDLVPDLRQRIVAPAWGIEAWRRRQGELWDRIRNLVKLCGDDTEAMNYVALSEALTAEFLSKSWDVSGGAGDTCAHGDFRRENVLVGSAGTISVLDFDLAHAAPAAFDVAYGALSFGGSSSFMTLPNGDQVASFLRAYQRKMRMAPDIVASALRWVTLRSISLSFKAEQIAPRFKIACNVAMNSDKWVETAL
jgi:Ser/Thr protein kinase RdoA (MazF antagonist)